MCAALLVTARLLVAPVFAAFPFAGTAAAPPSHHLSVQHPRVGLTMVPVGWTTTWAALLSGGIERGYLVIRPPASVKGPLPVLLVLAGRGLGPVEIERMTRLIPIVGNAIMVYPAGFERSWNAGACCGAAHARGIDDVAFLHALIRHVLATQPGASTRAVYLMGFSNGGRMAYRMACESPGLVAGFAAVEAVPVFRCPKLDPSPIAIVAQRGDPLLAIPSTASPKTLRGYVEPTVAATVQRWLALEGCRTAPALAAVGSARVAAYDRCRGAGRVEYVLYPGGRHDWPEGYLSTPSAGELIWAFLHRGGLPVLVRHGTRPGPRHIA